MSLIDRRDISDRSIIYRFAPPADKLSRVLLAMEKGRADAADINNSGYLPTLIISSMRTLKDGSVAHRGFYVDYRNPVQVERANGIEQSLRHVLDSGDNLRAQLVYQDLLEYTRSRHE